MNRNIRVTTLCLTITFMIATFPGCNQKTGEVMRAYDAEHHRMLVLTGEKTKIRNFYDTDYVVLGGNLGGIAAALAICESGRSVYLIEETDRVAGCISNSGVYGSPEGALAEKTGLSRNYRAFTEKLRTWYARKGKTPPVEVTGSGGFCFDGEAALAVIDEMLADKIAGGQLTVLKRHKVTKVVRYDSRIASLQMVDLNDRCVDQVVAYGYIDATEHGDLFPLAGIGCVAGSECASETGEPHAAAKADSLVAMRMCCCADSGITGEKGAGHEYLLTVREGAVDGTGNCVFPIMRESRRIRALDRVTEKDISADFQTGPRARFRPDAVGIGCAPITVESPDGGVTVKTLPFQIPLGALIPEDCDNLLAGSVNLGATRVASGAFHAPEIEWAVGEAAGYAIAFYAGYKAPLRNLLRTPEHIATFQHLLVQQYGVPIYWYDDVAPGDSDFAEAQLAPFKNPSAAEAAKTLHWKK